MKKLLFVLLSCLAIRAEAVNSNPIIGYVQLSTGPQQAGGFNTSTGTVMALTAASVIMSSNGSTANPSVSFQSESAGMGMYRYVQPTWSVTASSWNVGASTIFQPNHGLNQGAGVLLTTNGSLPGGLSAGTTYYVVWVDSNDFGLATNSSSISKIAFSTQGSGTHTLTPLTTHNLYFSVNGQPVIMLSTGTYWSAANATGGTQLFVGGRLVNTQPSEILHVEGYGGQSGDNSADIIVYNTSNSGARLIAQSNALNAAAPAVVSYLNSYGTGDVASFWTGGPIATNASELLFQNSSAVVFRVLASTNTVYFYNDQAAPRWLFYGHISARGSTPSIGTFGTGSPTITGTDMAGKLLANSGSPSSGNIVFAQPWTAAPICTAVSNFGATTSVTSVNVSSFTFALSSTAGNGQGIYYHCIGND